MRRPRLGCTLVESGRRFALAGPAAGLELPRRALDPSLAGPRAARGRTPLPAGRRRGARARSPSPAVARRQTKAVVVARDGRLVAERYAPGVDAQAPLLSWSMAKSVTMALVGVLVRDGRLDPGRGAGGRVAARATARAITSTSSCASRAGSPSTDLRPDQRRLADAVRAARRRRLRGVDAARLPARHALRLLERQLEHRRARRARRLRRGPRRDGALRERRALRRGGHGQRLLRARRVGHLHGLVLRLHDRARLGALRRAVPAGRRVGRPAHPAGRVGALRHDADARRAAGPLRRPLVAQRRNTGAPPTVPGRRFRRGVRGARPQRAVGRGRPLGAARGREARAPLPTSKRRRRRDADRRPPARLRDQAAARRRRPRDGRTSTHAIAAPPATAPRRCARPGARRLALSPPARPAARERLLDVGHLAGEGGGLRRGRRGGALGRRLGEPLGDRRPAVGRAQRERGRVRGRELRIGRYTREAEAPEVAPPLPNFSEAR
jgi:hypothetical protein